MEIIVHDKYRDGDVALVRRDKLQQLAAWLADILQEQVGTEGG